MIEPVLPARITLTAADLDVLEVAPPAAARGIAQIIGAALGLAPRIVAAVPHGTRAVTHVLATDCRRR